MSGSEVVAVTVYDTEFFAGRSETVTRSAAVVVPVLMRLFEPRSVLDVGCGQGEWVEAFRAGGVDAYGVDIAAPDEAHYFRRDLTEPFKWRPMPEDREWGFDLVLCLETGEHIPEESSSTLINTIAHAANHYVVFGAAVPGQAGKGHINCQPPEWWHQRFAAYGFEAQDLVRPHIQHPDVSPWYRDNTYALVR